MRPEPPALPAAAPGFAHPRPVAPAPPRPPCSPLPPARPLPVSSGSTARTAPRAQPGPPRPALAAAGPTCPMPHPSQQPGWKGSGPAPTPAPSRRAPPFPALLGAVRRGPVAPCGRGHSTGSGVGGAEKTCTKDGAVCGEGGFGRGSGTGGVPGRGVKRREEQCAENAGIRDGRHS
eukprot:scaffold33013_cov112-Isochrysis_galbana.AAC.4